MAYPYPYASTIDAGTASYSSAYSGGSFNSPFSAQVGSTYDGGARLRDVVVLVAFLLGVSGSTALYDLAPRTPLVVPDRSGSPVVEGYPAHLGSLDWVKRATGFSEDRIARLVGVSRQAINNWRRGEPIADANRRRILATRDVLERALARLGTSDLLLAWLDTPRGADCHTPADFLEDNQIDRVRLLALSSPSPGVKPPAVWANRPVHSAFRAGAERPRRAPTPDRDDELFSRFGEPGGADEGTAEDATSG